jgi:hypothetical protein
MRAVVVFESMFGNTRKIAEAIAEGLRDGYDVVEMPVSEFDSATLDRADLVVMGAPTHLHGLSRPASREAAKEQASKSLGAMTFEPGADAPGIRERLAHLRVLRCKAAAFDTKLRGPGILTGRASRKIARQLTRCGARLVLPPESYLVDKHNVLKPGELDRARAWGARLAASGDRSLVDA